MNTPLGTSQSAPVIFRGMPAQSSGGNRTVIDIERKGDEVFVNGGKVIRMRYDGTQITLTTEKEEYYVYNGTTPSNITVGVIYKYLKVKTGQS